MANLRRMHVLLRAIVAASLPISPALGDPPTDEECICKGLLDVHGAAITCDREFRFPPIGGYTDDVADEILPPGISTWRPFVSSCWATARVDEAHVFTSEDDPDPDQPLICGEDCEPTFELRGYAPAINLRFGVAQGDYGPVSLDPSRNTLPLAAASGGFGGPLSPLTRPTAGSTVDLITGQPLVREVDFELPFGNTVFRHIRTYSQYPELTVETRSATDGDQRYRILESGMYWDAAGNGWMLGHSPLLLIDAAYAGWDLGAPWPGEEQRNVERCVFLPDAHRAIPFHSLKDDGRYEASPRFDAALSHNGNPAHFDDTDGSEHAWDQLPTEWNVWLQNRSVKYTIKPVYDDVQSGGEEGVSIHDYPAPDLECAWNYRLFGTPHYGVATQIEDQFGNRIEIDYCSFKQRQDETLPLNDGCMTCCQECSAKGTIEQVRLIAGRADEESEEGRVAYKMIYVYREGNTLVNGNATLQGLSDFTQPMVHEIFVVPGHVEVPPGCRKIARSVIDEVLQPEEEYDTPLEQLEAYAAIGWGETEEIAFPDGDTDWLDKWIIHVKYLYTDDTEFLVDNIQPDGYGSGGLELGSELRLIQASVTTRERQSPDSNSEEYDEFTERTEHTIYRYRWNYLGSLMQQGQLRAVLRHDTLDRMRRAEGIPEIADDLELTAAAVEASWPLAVHLMHDTDVPDAGSTTITNPPDLLGWADQSYDYWNEIRAGAAWEGAAGFANLGTIDEAGTFEDMYLSEFHQEIVGSYLKGVPNNPTGDTLGGQRPEQPVLCFDGAATHVDRTGGQLRSYRIYRFLMTSTEESAFMVPECVFSTPEPPAPDPCDAAENYPFFADDAPMHRSLIHEPYLQRMWEGNGSGMPVFVYETSPAHPLWVAVVDEYETLDDLLDTAANGGDEWRSLAQIEEDEDYNLLPLTRRVVLMNPAGVVLSERIYDIRNGGLGSSEGMWEEFVYDWQDPDWCEDHNEADPIGRLIEHRTYGWSVAAGELDPPQVDAGLVNVYDYDLGSGVSDEMKKSLLPSKIGIKWGTDDTTDLVWLKQLIRDPKRPDLVVHDVDFLTQTAGTTPFDGPRDPEELAEEALEGGVRVTTRAYLEDIWRGAGSAPTDWQPPVIAEMTIQSPAKASPDGELLWPISISYTDMHWGAGGESDPPIDYRPGDKDSWLGVGAATTDALEGGKLYSVDSSSGYPRLLITFDPTDEEDVPEFFASVERSLFSGQTIFRAEDVDLGAVDGVTGELEVVDKAYAAVSATLVGSETSEFTGSFYTRAGLRVPFSDMAGQEPWVRRSDDDFINDHALEQWSYVGPSSTMPRFAVDSTGKQMRVFTKHYPAEGETPAYTEISTCDGLYEEDGVVGGSNVLTAFAPGTVVVEQDGVVTTTKKVIWPGQPSYGQWVDYSDPNIITWIEAAFDAVGRPNGVTVEDRTDESGQSLEQKVVYGRFGEISREKHHDGTVVRNVADERGRLVRVYKGSADDATYWGGGGGADDLILVEKRAYGTSEVDANLLVETRNYRTKPEDQYVPAGDEPDLDSEGYATRTVYDWRGRPLVTKFITGASTVVRQEIVFRDHADNVLLTATYGATHGWGTDEALPTLLPDSAPVPLALDVLEAGEDLIALESRTYNARGQVEVVTTYDVGDDTGESFLTTKTYSDFAGRVVWSQSSGNVVTRNVQDAKGRQIRTSTWHGSTELARTETAYTSQDQPFRVKSYERRHDELTTTDALDESNAIITYRFTWYDHAGRVRATADIGTGDDKSMAYFALDDVDTEDAADGFEWDFNEDVGWIDHTEFGDVVFFDDPEFVLPCWLPATARISSFGYDMSGNQVVTVDPMGVVTRSRYNGFGQLVLQWENAVRDLQDEPATDSRLTANVYDGTQVARVGVIVDTADIQPEWFDLTPDPEADPFDIQSLPWEEGDMLVSRVGTGAVVRDDLPPSGDDTAITPAEPSFAGSLTAWIDYPTTAELGDPEDPETPHDVTYTYYADGLLATRTDERGVVFKYFYDHAGRLTQLLADESNCSTYLHNITPPKDRIDKIEFEYDAAKGHLLAVLAVDRNGGPTGGLTGVSSNAFDYDSRGNLIMETQFHATEDLPTFDPTIWYTWDYHAADDVSGTANVDRLAEVMYPIPVPDGMSAMNRLFTLSYGTAGTATDALSLVTSLSEADAGFLAAFEYTGAGRRVAFNRGGSAGTPTVRSSVFGNPIAGWDQGGSPSPTDYDGLSPFGEQRALAYWRIVSGPTTEVLAAQRYSYDKAGRRTAAWHQHAPVAPASGPAVGTNERSQHFAYDALGRLTQADMGKLMGDLDGTTVTSRDVVFSDLMPLARRVGWDLNTRDTWAARTEIHDADNDGDGTDTGADETESALGHRVGLRNELWAHADPGATIDAEDRFFNDASGNLILDDDRFYEYDAWGRLVKVSDRGTLELDTPGIGEDLELEGEPGDWLVHYTYDGFGRLIRKQTPIRVASGVNAGVQTGLRTERYYYDGSRRIQEIVADTITGSDPDPLDGGILIEAELELLGEGESGGGGTGPTLAYPAYVGREYVYVPNGAGGYVDEFIGQFDRYGDLWWILQDANSNVLAMTDVDGEVVRQTLYDPYGEVLFAEDYAAHPGLKIGHQGLFFDRLEPPAPVSGGTVVSMGAAAQLTPGVFGRYHTNNRSYLPRYGRWAQTDPNASGMLHAALWHDGEAPIPEITAGSLDGVLTDGSNLFAFVGNSPYNATDPMGLTTLAEMGFVQGGLAGFVQSMVYSASQFGYAAATAGMNAYVWVGAAVGSAGVTASQIDQGAYLSMAQEGANYYDRLIEWMQSGASGPSPGDGPPWERMTSELKKLTGSEIRNLKDAGLDIHRLKDANSRVDLFRDEAGYIYRGLKHAKGVAEYTGYAMP